MSQRVLYKLTMALLMMVAGLVCGVVLLICKQYVLGVLSCSISGWMFFIIIRLFNSTTKKAAFMFNAIENNDFTFQFAENIGSRNERHFNHALNRVKDLINQAKQSIKERDKYYEVILDKSTNGIVVIDPTSGIVFQANKASLDMFGLTALTHVNQLSIVGADIAQSLLEAKPLQNATIGFYNETNKVSLSLRSATVQLGGKDLKIISINDISQELDRQQTDSWTRLSRVLTHEIMNSLAPITSLSSQLQKTTDPQTLHRGLEVICQSSEGLIRFVDNYRRLTRVPTPSINRFSMIRMIEKQVSLLDHKIETSGIDKNLMLQADENLISQVVVNLLKNAIQATQNIEGKGNIWINGHSNSRGIALEICNDGPMIDPLIRENIFVPFFTTKTNGSGIGLSLSRQIMRLHNGTLTHADKTIDTLHATVFTMQFPD